MLAPGKKELPMGVPFSPDRFFLKIDPREVLLASTGVIGKPFPGSHGKGPTLASGFPFAKAWRMQPGIMTTDTKPKAAISRGRVNGEEVTLAGIAKGPG